MTNHSKLLSVAAALLALFALLALTADTWLPSDVAPADAAARQPAAHPSTAQSPTTGTSGDRERETVVAPADASSATQGNPAVAQSDAATIQGIVLDPDGLPAPDTYVHAGDLAKFRSNVHTRSAADGSFTLQNLPPGATKVHARHDRLGRASRTVVTTAATTTTCDLRLSMGLALHGVVLREDNTPVASASVGCSWPGNNRHRTTDELGRFTIINCPEQAMHFRVEAEGIHRLMQAGVDPRAGDVILRVQSIGVANAKLTGRVVSPDDVPLANIEVLAGRAGQSILKRLSAKTAADGTFAFEPIVAGSWYLTIATEAYPSHESGPHELAANGHQNLGTIRLSAGGTLRARVQSGDAAGVSFRTRRQDGEPSQGVPQLRGGHIESPLLRPGAYNLLVYGNECAEQTVPFTIRKNEQTELDLELQRGVLQRFEVTVPAATTGSLTVDLVIQRGSQLVRQLKLRAVTKKPRNAKIWLTPGSYTLTATGAALRAEAQFEVGTEEAPRMPIRVR